MFTLLLIVIGIALAFDLINGFHDAANSIATVVSTKVLSPFTAVLWAAAFNMLAYLIFDLKVADTVAKTVHPEGITLPVILAGLIAAVIWNLITWYYGIPSSSSHTLIGGFAGAAIAHVAAVTFGETGFFWESLGKGFSIVAQESILKTFLFIFLAPIIGMIIAYFITVIVVHLCRRASPRKADRWFRRLQLVSSAAFSLGHGGSDSQKVIGIIMAAMIAFSHLSADDIARAPKWVTEFTTEFTPIEAAYKADKKLSKEDPAAFKNKVAEYKKEKAAYTVAVAKYHEVHKTDPTAVKPVKPLNPEKLEFTHLVPKWLPFLCYLIIGLGTMMGGWRIVKTMGSKITKVTPLEGMSAETAGAITLFGVSQGLGVPVSTTHTITGAIIGVGMTKRLSAVRWGVTINLFWAWVITIPISGAIAALAYFLLSLFM